MEKILCALAGLLVFGCARTIPIKPKDTRRPYQWKRSVICPIDSSVSVAYGEKKGHLNGTSLEFRSNGTIDDPVPLPICPKCKFPIHKEAFSDSEIILFRDITNNEEYRGIDPKSAPYFYLARLYEINNEAPEKIAYAYLNAAWQADDSLNYELAEKYRRSCAVLFRKALQINPENKLYRMLSIELARRLGKFSNADSIYSTISKKNLVKTDAYFLNFEHCLILKEDKGNHYFSEAKSCDTK